MSYTIIAAIGKNNELGRNNELIWHLPNDLKFFKEITTGHTIIMGRKTLESLPKLLPNRHHIVLSSKEKFEEPIEHYKTLKNLLESLKDREEEMFVIGGASIYKEFIDIVDKMYITEIDSECKEADAYFPEFNKSNWNRTIIKENEDNGITYKHVLYKRSKLN